MKQAAGRGPKTHEMPSLGDICSLTTCDKVVGYLVGNNLIDNQSGNVCGKVYNYPHSSKQKAPCTGTLNIEGPNDGKMCWRCNRCRVRHTIFKGTLLDRFKIPLSELFQILYLSMLYVPVSTLMILSCDSCLTLHLSLISLSLQQKHIVTMTRSAHQTVAKIQGIVLLVIGCDHGTTDAILRFHGCCGRAFYSILFRVYFAVLVLVRKGHERFPRVISAKLNFIAQNGGDFRFGFYGLGVISSSTGVVNGSMDGQYRPEGFYKRMGRIEHKLKMCLISASDMCNCLFLNILTWP